MYSNEGRESYCTNEMELASSPPVRLHYRDQVNTRLRQASLTTPERLSYDETRRLKKLTEPSSAVHTLTSQK